MENSLSVKQSAVPYGLTLALLGILLLVIVYALGLSENNVIMSILSFGISVFIYYLGINDFKKKNRNYLSLGQALKVGMAIAGIAGLISAIYAYIHYKFIFTEFSEITLENAREEIIKSQPSMTEAQIQQALSYSEMFISPVAMSVLTLAGTLFFGFIISLIIGLIMKKQDPALA